MNSEDKFKKQLEDKLRSKEFSFDDANWHSMRDMIDESRNKKKRRVLFFLLFLIGILGSMSVYLFTVAEAPVRLAINKNKPALPSAEKPTPAAENKAQSTIKSTPYEAKHVEPDSKIKPPVVAEKASIKPISTPAQAERLSVKNISSNQTREPLEKTNVDKESKPVHQSTTQALPLLVSSATPPSNPKEVNVTSDDAKTSDLVIHEKANETKTNFQDPASLPSSFDTKQNTDSTTSPALAIEEKPEVIESKTLDSLTTTVLSMAAGDKKDSVLNPVSVKPLSADSPAYAKHIISLEAGSNYMAGWKVKDKRDGNGLNFVAGVNYTNFVKRHIGVSAGIHYTSVRNLSAFSHTSTVTTYGFGEKTDITVITPEKIHYLQLPLKIIVKLNDKNFVGAGYTLGYLLTVNSKTEKRSDGFSYETASEVSKAKGYTEGFSSYDSQVSVFYRRMIYKKLFINAEAIFGLTDTQKNAFFPSNSTERNIGLKLTLMYNIFQK